MKMLKDWVKNLPERKKYVDFITAAMSVPILLTVMVTNFSNLSNKNETNAAPRVEEIIKIVPVAVENNSSEKESTPTPTVETIKNVVSTPSTNSPSCKKEVGPVSIVSPAENEIIKSNPICIDISHKSGEYCVVSWSYRVDDGAWSEYMDKSICLHNLTNGPKKIELKIKSVSSSDTTVLVRNFIYSGQSSVTATTAPTVSPTPTENISTTSASLTTH